jgi:membrane-anchored glycerophosphoryl diester phosphodiesterase (GDPDase)
LLWEAIIAIGFILLIVPGIVLAVRLAFVPFLVVDEGRGPVEALTESWNRTNGYSWTILGAAALAVVIILVGLVLLVVGSIPATMLAYLAFASLYAGVTARKAATGAASIAATGTIGA